MEVQILPNNQAQAATLARNAMGKMGLPGAPSSRVEYVPGGTLISAVAMTTPCDDYDKMFLLHAHACTFPHGKGWCPEGMSFLEWVRIILRRHPIEQHSRNCGFLANAFNLYQRHLVNTHSGLEVKMRPYMVEKVKRLSQEDIQEVLRIYGTGLGGDAFNKAMSALPSEANVLLQSLRITGARVPGTPGSFKSLRSMTLSAVTVHGQYTCMLNLCPFESSSPHTFTLMGKPYTFDRKGMPVGRPGYIECLAAIASNPVACAHFIDAYMRAFTHRMLGWPMGAKKQIDPTCLFGKVTFVYLKYESSGRGGKHAHGQIVQPLLQTKRLEELFREGRTVRKQLYAFMESFSCSVMPSPEGPVAPASRAPSEGPSAPTVRWDPQVGTEDLAPTDRDVMHQRPPLNRSQKKLLKWALKVLRSCNIHKHMPTCAKGCRKGDHCDCRMGYDRLLVPKSQRLQKDMLMVLLRRNNGMLVPYILALVLACPSNHTMALAMDASRFLREHQVWQDLMDAGEDAGDEPTLPDAWLASAITSEYATKYSTKADNTPFNQQMLAVAQSISEDGDAKAAKRLISKMLNKITGSITYPLIMCASYLLGHDDRWFPGDMASHDLRAFHLNLVRREQSAGDVGGVDEGEEDHTLNFVAKGGTTATHASSKVMDYECRSESLAEWSPIEVTMSFEVQDKRTRAARALPLEDPHPQAGRKGHNTRANIHIPLTFCNAPVPPDPDATAEEKDAWAAWVLGNFFPYDSMLHLLKGRTLIKKYEYWRKHKIRGEADDVAFHLLDNMMLAAHAREAIRERDKATRVRRSQMRAAGLEPTSTYEHGCDFEAIDDRGEEYDLHPDCNVDEATYARIDSLLTEGPDQPNAGAADRYMNDAMSAIARQPLPPPAEASLSDSCVPADPGTRGALNAAVAAMKEARPGKLRELTPKTVEERHQLSLRTEAATGKVYCKLVYKATLPLAPNEAELIRALNEKLRERTQPPYIHLKDDQRPSMAATSDLFRLCDKQRFAFFMMASTLDAELRGERDLPQLKMALLGGAGTGKSEVNQALLWYAFQHRACNALTVMAYTWKAALLLGNPYNPGYSTSTACGIPCVGQRATLGTSEKAMAIMHPEVRFVLIDEISFVSQKHLGVSPQGGFAPLGVSPSTDHWPLQSLTPPLPAPSSPHDPGILLLATHPP
jgi:hypothetical protein